MSFTHLHNHSDGSTPVSHDGLGTVHRLVKAAKEKGFKSLALTDHGNLINVPSLLHACDLNDIKAITGLEAYVEHENQPFHLTILADGNEGFDTLVNLNNLAQNNWSGKRPKIKLTDFEKNNKGIIVLTGCPNSPLQKNDWNEARKIGLYLKNIFGARLFAELMFVGFEDSLERSVKLAKDLKLPLVLTNDCHFPYKEDAKAHEIITLMHGGYDYDSSKLFLATREELEQRVKEIAPEYLSYFEQGANNAYGISEKLRTIKFDNTLSLPKIENPDERLKELVSNGISFRSQNGFEITPETKERIDYEFQTISEMGFSPYFVILSDIVNYARSINVRVGNGRGSGSGSLLLYLMGITEINPLKYDLKFERFINKKRLDWPDVDVDYSTSGRSKIIEYAKSRWGGLPVATYSRYSADSLINDLAKYFTLPKDETKKLKESGFTEDGSLTDYYYEFAAKNPEFDDCYQRMNGQIRHIGKHAGGIVITDKNIPTIRINDENVIASWTEGLHSHELEKVGVVKFDILGVTSYDILEILESKFGKCPEPVDSSEVFKVFQTGDTLGIFQFTKRPITQYTMEIQPNKFMDLVAITSLWRPGPMQGAAPNYKEYKKNGQRKLHPLIDDILEETYGVITYQEQFMSIYAKVTDGDLGDADLARKILVKGQGQANNPEWQKKLQTLADKFLTGCKNKGIDDSTANLIWSEIKTHSGYSFNKSHAVAYTLLSYQLAYFKYHHRAEFYAAALSVDDSKSEEYLYDVIRSGITVVRPDINLSSDHYTSDGTKIYQPLIAIKGLGEKAQQEIIRNRPYTTYSDLNNLPKRKVNIGHKEALFAVGCLNNLKGDVNELGLRTYEFGDKEEIQQKYFDFALPTPEYFKAIDKAEKQGMIAGRITKIEEKLTKVNNKKYWRYYLDSGKSLRSWFWLGFKVGSEVKLKYKDSDYGMEINKGYYLDYENF